MSRKEVATTDRKQYQAEYYQAHKGERKTKTSSQVKTRWNAKTYDRLQLNVKKEKAAAYKAKCKELGISYSEPLHRAIDEILNREKT